MSDPETLRAYASILEKPTRELDPVLQRHVMHEPSEILKAAAVALRFQADAISHGDRQ